MLGGGEIEVTSSCQIYSSFLSTIIVVILFTYFILLQPYGIYHKYLQFNLETSNYIFFLINKAAAEIIFQELET